jgi:hypothetical protein
MKILFSHLKLSICDSFDLNFQFWEKIFIFSSNQQMLEMFSFTLVILNNKKNLSFECFYLYPTHKMSIFSPIMVCSNLLFIRYKVSYNTITTCTTKQTGKKNSNTSLILENNYRVLYCCLIRKRLKCHKNPLHTHMLGRMSRIEWGKYRDDEENNQEKGKKVEKAIAMLKSIIKIPWASFIRLWRKKPTGKNSKLVRGMKKVFWFCVLWFFSLIFWLLPPLEHFLFF